MQFIDLFAGAGGLSEGLSEAGFHSLFANEIMPVYARTYARNHVGTKVVTTDIRGLDADKVREEIGIERIENMHELGVVFHIIDDLKEVAASNEITEITKVVLELGEVSTVIDSYLTDCWKWAIKKEELLKDSELVIEKINAVTYCEDCKSEYETVKYGKICPKCGSRHTYLLRGSEFNIKEIEAC